MIRFRIMSKYSKNRNGLIHLYNPEEEGLGSYDLNYINAYKNIKILKIKSINKDDERYAA